jgi:hypothetical protein
MQQMIYDLQFELLLFQLNVNDKSRQFMCVGKFCESFSLIQAAHGLNWSRAYHFNALGLYIDCTSNSNNALNHRLHVADVILIKNDKFIRVKVPKTIKLDWYCKSPQTAAIYASSALHVTKELLINAKRWETKALFKTLRFYKFPLETFEAYNKRRSHLTKELFKLIGRPRIFHRILAGVIRASTNDGKLAEIQAERGMKWRTVTTFTPYKKRKIEGACQAKRGRRVGFDDWLFEIFGVDWFLLAKDAREDRHVLWSMVNKTCIHFGLPTFDKYTIKISPYNAVNDIRSPKFEHIDDIFKELSSSIHHPDDEIWDTKLLQFEFIVDNQILSLGSSGLAQVSGDPSIDLLSGIQHLCLQKAAPRFGTFPHVRWRPRKWNQVADALANFALDFHDIEWSIDYPLVDGIQSGAILAIQCHSDGAFRNRSDAAIAFAVSIIRTNNKGVIQRVLIAACAKRAEARDSYIAEVLALNLAICYISGILGSIRRECGERRAWNIVPF